MRLPWTHIHKCLGDHTKPENGDNQEIFLYKIYRHAISWSPDLFPGVHVEVVVVVILERILPYPDGLAVVVSGRVLETVRGDQDVVEELEADVDPFFAAVLDLAHDNLLQVGPEYEHPKLDSRVRGSIT